jgi:hypothetical protein
VSATVYQLNADFLFEGPDLPTERRLGSVKLLLGGNGQTACISDSNEVAEMPKLHHNLPCIAGMGPAYKVFFRRTSALYKQKALHAEVCLAGRADRDFDPSGSPNILSSKARPNARQPTREREECLSKPNQALCSSMGFGPMARASAN